MMTNVIGNENQSCVWKPIFLSWWIMIGRYIVHCNNLLCTDGNNFEARCVRLLAIDDANGPVKTVLKQPIVVVAEASYRGSMSSEGCYICERPFKPLQNRYQKTKACYT